MSETYLHSATSEFRLMLMLMLKLMLVFIEIGARD
jgi:hypothetical protein